MRKYLQTKKTTLSYSISDSETTIRLSALTKLDGTSVSASDIGDYMTGTFDPGTSKEEIFSIASSGVTVNADGTVDITGVVRGLKEIDPYTTGGYSAEHGAGAVVVFSNNPQLYSQMANKSNDNTFTGQNIFSGYAPQTNTDPVAGNDLTRLSYVQALVLGTLTSIDVVVPGTAGETIADGNLIYLFTDNKWYKTDADTASTVNNVLLGIAKGAGTTNGQITNGILLQGVDNAQSGLTGGQVQYASNTAGAISSTPGTTEVTVGIAKSATELYFAPRFNQMLTENQQDAMDSANSPSAANYFLTLNDSAENTASKLVIRKSDSNITVPTAPTASTDAVSKAYADGRVNFQLLGSASPDVMGIGFSQDGSQMFHTYFNANNQFTLVRWARDSVTGQYYQLNDGIATIVGSAIFTSGTTVQGIAVVGSYVYVSMTSYVYRFSSTNIAGGGTNLTISGTAPSGNPCAMYTDGTDLYINSGSGTTWYRYTISGTTITNAQTLTGPSGYNGAWSNGTKAYLYNGSTLGRYAHTLGTVEATTAIQLSGFGSSSGYSRGVGYANATSVFLGTISIGTGCAIMLSPVTKP